MVFRSPLPDVVVPDLPLHRYLFEDLGERAERVALVDGATGAETTYAALAASVERFAAGLAARGVGRGDVVGLISPNTPAYATAFHGVLRAGATVTTVNALYTVDEIAHQLADAGATLLLTVSPLLPQSAAAAEKAGVADVVVLDGAEGYPSAADLLACRDPAPEDLAGPEDLAVLPYSSGTTGRAKGVMLTHRNLVANVAQCEPALGLGPDSRVLAVLPFFHIYGMNVLMNMSLAVGARVVTMPRFDLPEFLRVIAEHRTDRVYIAPPVAVALAKHPLVDQYDLSAVDTVFSGAAPLDAALGEAVAARLGCRVVQGYGMTEMSPVSHATPADALDVPIGTVGVLIPNMECRLVDPATGEDVADRGELWCRGPNVMKGYLNNPDATAATLDEDGWLRTGDVAEIDANGHVSIVDRVKELIKYKGYQVPPAELEALLLTHPAIADAAVIGSRDADGEEIPKAFVVRQPGAELDAAGVMSYVAERVAPHKKVRAVEFIDAVPKSVSGKILRKDLRARERA
ncbi:4-coumarate--CoA ligase family protein [Actinosynnema mirum]|uniref:AMP-dependent synthetase and ligase n=1 Tax=Actinosynnema mirum (strain ATCC 29888 / DSM 43827 / JCM 3225 / NBRC 14064 / NCIMB 13271 / NRRL B-12336 / IMRU 3971 / 101) TaxID=446462 RepID=C6WPK0_ACTMD|nr:4-coumarate--CoA ligase family protein [Actinosynnema mirum]ACU40551.1 AMP-dependent synthetase and ligase [Actinosynnema mirum DSM 43827]